VILPICDALAHAPARGSALVGSLTAPALLSARSLPHQRVPVPFLCWGPSARQLADDTA
jgi:hypothetical protein